MGDQKQHGDVFGLQQSPVLLVCVARAPVQDENRPLVKGPKASSQGLPRCLDARDEDTLQPLFENVTSDVTILVEKNVTFSGLYPDSKTHVLSVLFLVIRAGFSLEPSSAMHTTSVQR